MTDPDLNDEATQALLKKVRAAITETTELRDQLDGSIENIFKVYGEYVKSVEPIDEAVGETKPVWKTMNKDLLNDFRAKWVRTKRSSQIKVTDLQYIVRPTDRDPKSVDGNGNERRRYCQFRQNEGGTSYSCTQARNRSRLQA